MGLEEVDEALTCFSIDLYPGLYPPVHTPTPDGDRK